MKLYQLVATRGSKPFFSAYSSKKSCRFSRFVQKAATKELLAPTLRAPLLPLLSSPLLSSPFYRTWNVLEFVGLQTNIRIDGHQCGDQRVVVVPQNRLTLYTTSLITFIPIHLLHTPFTSASCIILHSSSSPPLFPLFSPLVPSPPLNILLLAQMIDPIYTTPPLPKGQS